MDNFFTSLIRKKKKYIFITIASTIVFTVLIFPYDDLSDLISDKIYIASNKKIFIQFERLGLSFFPPSLKLTDVHVNNPYTPTIKAGALFMAPSISSLLAFQPGFAVTLEKFLEGEVDLTYRAGKKVSEGIQLQNLSVGIEQVEVRELTQLLSAPISITGKMSGEISSQLDLTFTNQPDGKIKVMIDEFDIPETTVPTPLGPFPVPNLKLKQLVLKGRLENGQFYIEEGQVGAPGDPINGQVSGRLAVRFIMAGNNVTPQWGNFELGLDLNFDKLSEKNFSLFLGFIDSYKTNVSTGSRYAFNLSGPNFYAPPKLSSYSKK